MKLIEDKIMQDSVIINNDIIKVDSFLNHQIDCSLMEALAEDCIKFFEGSEKITKVLTIETSGIAVAYPVANKLGVPLVFAKKSKSAIVGNDVYETEIKSFTRNIVSKVTVSNRFLKNDDVVLIVDDFLAEGNAGLGLLDLCAQAGAKVAGFMTAIEKGFQPGRKKLEEKGVKVYSGAIIKEFKDNKPVF